LNATSKLVPKGKPFLVLLLLFNKPHYIKTMAHVLATQILSFDLNQLVATPNIRNSKSKNKSNKKRKTKKVSFKIKSQIKFLDRTNDSSTYAFKSINKQSNVG
jgi:mannitol-specific phosphotransferase system IIBC component